MRNAFLVALLLATTAHAQEGPKPIDFAIFASGHDRPFAVDVNGDGYADLVAFAGNDVWVALSDEGQKCRAGSVWIPGFASPDEPAAAADFDGDGRADVLALKKDGSIRVGVSDGHAFAVQTWTCAADASVLAPLASRPMLAVDVDGDGFCDLVFLPDSHEPGASVWLRNTGLHSFEAPAPWGDAPRDAVAGRFRGDGSAQLAWVRDGKVLVASRSGKPEVWADDVKGSILAAGDMNGDGRDDLAVRGAWLLSHGTGFVRFDDARLSKINVQAACSVGDLDGDGEGDLFVFERVGDCRVRVLLSRGPHFSQPESWASLDLKSDERLVDLGDMRVVLGKSLLEGDGKLGVRPPKPAPELTLPAGPHVVASFHGRRSVIEPARARSLDEGWERPGPFTGTDDIAQMLAPDLAVTKDGHVIVARGGEVVTFALEPATAKPLYAAPLVGKNADIVA
ncbi:MAG TPA: VCBS repeat-containing protein, partial [Planctomycetota bacterium]|nr:VCBS repeat-containing protein [Planctomycetota bacterium]